MTYEALFCPHCGKLVNGDWDTADSPDRLVDEPTDPAYQGLFKPKNPGPIYTCGWCGIQTRDWDHVKECRWTHTEKERMKLKATKEASLDMLKQLGQYRKERD